MINVIGAITGALSGATGGKISIDRVVEKAVSKAAQSPLTDLKGRDVSEVAEVIKRELPEPQAMEGLGWQNLRSALIALGGYLVGAGYLQQEEMLAIVGVLMIVIPWGYRNVSTWIARRPAAKA